MTSGPSAISRSTGTIDLVARGAANEVVYRQYVEGTGWTSWMSDLGGPIGGQIASRPGIAGAGNVVHFFARGADDAVWHRVWTIGPSGKTTGPPHPDGKAGNSPNDHH